MLTTADVIAVLRMLTQTFSRAPAIVVICDNVEGGDAMGAVDIGLPIYETAQAARDRGKISSLAWGNGGTT